jgi:hypothetical protein
MIKKKKKWSEMTNLQRAGVVVMGAIQISLAIAAWTDLAKRDPAKVNGPKGRWAGIIGINFVGPILYFTVGRRSD